MATTPRPRGRTESAGAPLVALRVTAALALASVVWQFVSAGRVFADPSWLALHGGGAVVLHVATGLAALAALWWWRSGGSAGVAVLAVVTFALTFLQAWSGDHAPLAVHVPLSLSVVGTTLALLGAALTAGRARVAA